MLPQGLLRSSGMVLDHLSRFHTPSRSLVSKTTMVGILATCNPSRDFFNRQISCRQQDYTAKSTETAMWTQIFVSRCERPRTVNTRTKKDLPVPYGDADFWSLKKPSSRRGPSGRLHRKNDSLVLGGHPGIWQRARPDSRWGSTQISGHEWPVPDPRPRYGHTATGGPCSYSSMYHCWFR